MIKRSLSMLKRCTAPRAHALGLGLAALAAILGAISCGTVTRPVVVLPNVPGARYIGSKECEQCHDQICKEFPTADHARLMALGTNALNAGCESCHGPCSLHSDSGGDVKPPYSFAAGRMQTSSFGASVTTDPARAGENVCFTCHADVRAKFTLASHHPAPEGNLSCSACHSPHKGSIHVGGGTAILSENESCLRCHPSQRGPYAFEHEALREGCSMCHNAHGSVNAKLLTERNANLCLKCHFQRVSGGTLLIGNSDHTLRAQQGACWTAGCHEAVHGSRVSPSLQF